MRRRHLTTPIILANRRFGLLPFRSPLLGEWQDRTSPTARPPKWSRDSEVRSYCFLFLQVLRCFTSLGALLPYDRSCQRQGVSPFGDLRIKGCYTPPRSLSQLRHVLHRYLESRHPPYALRFPIRKSKTAKLCLLCSLNFLLYEIVNVRT